MRVKHNIPLARTAKLQRIRGKYRLLSSGSQGSIAVRHLMRFATESDGAWTVYRFGVRQVNATLRTFDHRFGSAIASWGG